MSSATHGSSTPNFKQQMGRSASLLDALDAATKWPAFALLSATLILSLVGAALFGAVTLHFTRTVPALAIMSSLIGFLVVLLISMIGINATGILLSDDVWGRRQRSVGDAILVSAFTFHRLLVVLLLEFLLFLVFLLALTFLLFLCKIPGLGPVLFAVVMPAGVIATGLVSFALLYIAIPLASPAIWNGSSVKHTLLMLQAVARKRLLTAVTMMVLLGLLSFLVVGFVWAVMGLGAVTVFSLSAIVLGVTSGGVESIMYLFMSGGVSGYLYAMGFGGAVLLLVGANPGILIALKGVAIIYREVATGLSLEEDEKELDRRMDGIKARAEQARQQAHAAMQQPATPAAPVAPAVYATAPAPVPPALACPSCKEAVTPDDVFCGGCGHRLK